VWIFATGPRRTLQLNGTFNPHDADDIKLLNHSAIRDEVQDFELNTRAVQGGKGLITLADGDTPDPNVFNLNPLASSGRSELLDDMAFWVARGVRTPIAPPGDASAIAAGKQLFTAANCQSCHGGGGWSVARRTFTPPPDASLLKGVQVIGALRQVGTFDPAAVNEVRDNGSPPLGADGFVPPSLLGAHAFPPYLHNGSAQTIADVLDNVTHRSAGTGGVDVLTNAADRAALAHYVESIDASTDFFPIAAPGQRGLRSQGQDAATAELSALQVSPNPARLSTVIGFTLSQPSRVRLSIYDPLGRRIATLAEGFRPAGRYQTAWDGRSQDGSAAWSGVYFVRLEAEERTRTTALVFTR
jgi:flagellar hook capping protein FlgD/cytochrome c